MTNKYNIDDYVFYNNMRIDNPKVLNVTLGKIVEIKKVNSGGGYCNIIYMVKFIQAINYEISHSTITERGLRDKRELNEDCLHTSQSILECLFNK